MCGRVLARDQILHICRSAANLLGEDVREGLEDDIKLVEIKILFFKPAHFGCLQSQLMSYN